MIIFRDLTGENFVPLYTLEIDTKKIEEKGSQSEELDCFMKDVFS